MFKFLKDKIKDTVSRFAKAVDEEAESEVIEQKTEPEEVEEKEEVSEDKKEEEPENVEEKKEEDVPLKEEKEETEEAKIPEDKAAEEPKQKKEVKESVEEHSEEKKEEEPKPVDLKEDKEEVLVEDKEAEEDKKESKSEEKEVSQSKEEPKEEKKGFFSKIFGKKKTEDFTEEEVKETEEKLEELIEGKKPETKEEPEEKVPEEKKPEPKKEEAEKLKEEPKKEEEKPEEKVPEKEDIKKKEDKPSEPEKKKGIFSGITQAITTKRLSEEKFEELFWDLELVLLESNTAVEVIEKIKSDLKKELVDNPIRRSEITSTIINTLKRSIEEIISIPGFDILEKSNKKKPLVVCFVGVNGSGKTTSIAKIANMLKENGKSVVLAAADTFRAAAIDQLEEHATNLDVKIIKHDYGSDAAAVAFDAVVHAKSKEKDVVLIDTAGRLHSNSNLMDELKKVIKVVKPDLTIFVGESITGNDCIEQAQKFGEAVQIDGIILSKADIDEKGGAAISVSYITKKPILYIGTGQEYSDIEKFDKKKIMENLGF